MRLLHSGLNRKIILKRSYRRLGGFFYIIKQRRMFKINQSKPFLSQADKQPFSREERLILETLMHHVIMNIALSYLFQNYLRNCSCVLLYACSLNQIFCVYFIFLLFLFLMFFFLLDMKTVEALGFLNKSQKGVNRAKKPANCDGCHKQ